MRYLIKYYMISEDYEKEWMKISVKMDIRETSLHNVLN